MPSVTHSVSPEFQDLLYQNQRRVGADSSDAGTIVPAGVQVGLGVRTAAVYRITEQGNLTLTENPLDLAINGNGYFQITLPNGDTAYTRAGSLQLSASGQIVTVDGFQVAPGLTVPQNAIDISVNPTGQVLVDREHRKHVIIARSSSNRRCNNSSRSAMSLNYKSALNNSPLL